MSNLSQIYAVWDGNAEAMAADIGELGVTVRQWRNRGSIPVKYWPKIIEAAKAHGAMLDLALFVHVPEGALGEAEVSPDIAAGSIGARESEGGTVHVD